MVERLGFIMWITWGKKKQKRRPEEAWMSRRDELERKGSVLLCLKCSLRHVDTVVR